MKDWKNIVSAVAPALATALGGPLAGIAVKAIAGKLLGNPDATEAEVAQAVAGMGPADLIKLKEIEADLTKSLQDAGIKLEEVAARDRDSARTRQKDMKDPTPNVLAFLTLGTFGLVLWMLFDGQSLGADAQVIYILLGTLTAAVTQVLNFYFGSSAGSARARDALAGIAQRRAE